MGLSIKFLTATKQPIERQVIYLAVCPQCAKEVIKPSKTLKNSLFTIQAYSCEKCHCNFKEIR